MKIPEQPRYERTMRAAKAFLKQERITEFPIDVFEIARRNGWVLVSYSDLMDSLKVNLNAVIHRMGSRDGATFRQHGLYFIAYNDRVKSPGRIRFTIAHEIGHIYLNHLVHFERTRITRLGLTPSEMEVLENEADCFARNVLSPSTIVKFLQLREANQLIKPFGLSFKAARTRLNFLRCDHETPFNFLLGQAWPYLKRIRFGKQCGRCGHSFVSVNDGVVFCPICGNADRIERSDEGPKVIYDGYELNEEGYPIHECPRCGNEELRGYEFCTICGTQLFNRCTNFSRDLELHLIFDRNLDGQARYCSRCGAESAYFKEKLLRPWHVVKKELGAEQKSDSFPR